MNTKELLNADMPPDPGLMIYVGIINIHWSMIEAAVSGALFSLLSIDKHEFGILVGRLEINPKLKKLSQILEHRNDGRFKTVDDLLCKVESIRQDRNAITHGVYQGKSQRGEYFFALADVLLDKEEGPAFRLRVFTLPMLHNHVSETIEILGVLSRTFDAEKMMKLHNAQFRIPKHLREVPLPAKPEEKP